MSLTAAELEQILFKKIISIIYLQEHLTCSGRSPAPLAQASLRPSEHSQISSPSSFDNFISGFRTSAAEDMKKNNQPQAKDN